MRRTAALMLLASVILAGCSASPGADSAAEDASPTAAATPAPDEAMRDDPELAAFRNALEARSPLDPDALVDAVVAAGFPSSSLERTRELDSLGAPVSFLEIAARVDDGCLIGQVGDGPPMAIRTEALASGRCLVGDVIRLD
ncbi:DUF6993 domain-containing protein [Agrococcus sp. Ld7]|uniref:DUF6993 domain-containing protein n=1 Tax=Agrococcus sp. Ld7 TaxID=649148 RepID=UPI00386A8A33